MEILWWAIYVLVICLIFLSIYHTSKHQFREAWINLGWSVIFGATMILILNWQ